MTFWHSLPQQNEIQIVQQQNIIPFLKVSHTHCYADFAYLSTTLSLSQIGITQPLDRLGKNLSLNYTVD
jgi:hypothetical protein